jgi:hypothetical protein
MKRIAVFLMIMFFAIAGCAEPQVPQTPDDTVAPQDAPEPADKEGEELFSTEYSGFVIPGDVFAEKLEGFDEEIPVDWNVVKYVTLEENPEGVYEEDGTVRLVAEETDRVPILYSTPIDLDGAKYITLHARLKTSYANEYYTGDLGLWFTDQEELMVEVDPESWPKNFGRRVVQTEYVNYYSDSSRRIVDNGFILYTSSVEHGTKVEAFANGVFDEWFEQQFVINLETGEVTCQINEEVISSMIDIPEENFIAGIKSRIKPKFVDLNIEAFKKGRDSISN